MVQMHLMILMTNGHCYYYSSEICHNKGDQYMDIGNHEK